MKYEYMVYNPETKKYVNFYSGYEIENTNWASSFTSEEQAINRIKTEKFNNNSLLKNNLDKYIVVKIDLK